MISSPLSDFTNMFNLESKKEVMPYTLYTGDFVKSGAFATRQYIEENSPHFNDFSSLFANLDSLPGCVCDIVSAKKEIAKQIKEQQGKHSIFVQSVQDKYMVKVEKEKERHICRMQEACSEEMKI
eukprot:1156040-Pleurochrysis_carterae.AAC.1